MRQYAAQSGERLDIDVVGPRYEDVTKIADSMYEVCEENADYFQAVLVQWQSFEESSRKFDTWMDNMVQKSFAAARKMPEDDIDAVLMKLMKYRELDRKFTERQPSKDGLVYEAEQVLTATGENAPNFFFDSFRKKSEEIPVQDFPIFSRAFRCTSDYEYAMLSVS